jgi:hypothetical protein
MYFNPPRSLTSKEILTVETTPSLISNIKLQLYKQLNKLRLLYAQRTNTPMSYAQALMLLEYLTDVPRFMPVTVASESLVTRSALLRGLPFDATSDALFNRTFLNGTRILPRPFIRHVNLTLDRMRTLGTLTTDAVNYEAYIRIRFIMHRYSPAHTPPLDITVNFPVFPTQININCEVI